jgi:hypothetical protein
MMQERYGRREATKKELTGGCRALPYRLEDKGMNSILRRGQPIAGERGQVVSSDSPHTISEDEYFAATGEEISTTLNLDTWQVGVDIGALYQRIQAEVGPAIALERRVQQTVRDRLFPMLRTAQDAPKEAGVHTAKVTDLDEVHRKVLFSGELETCDGTTATHDTPLLTVTQIGICLVSYQGNELTLSQRLFRRDLRAVAKDPVEEVDALLERRRSRAATDVNDRRGTMTELGRRGIMTYAERAALLDRSKAAWRMGHGNIAPYELLTGSGNMKLLEKALEVLRGLIAYKQFVFVPSAIKDRVLLTVGGALRPLEYAVVSTAETAMGRIVNSGHYEEGYGAMAESFVREIGPQIVLGVYRASALSPGVPFFAHADSVHAAAHIAMADSALQEHRGFPLSIDLADAACRAMFGADTFDDAVNAAYHLHGEPTRYFPERHTREK